MKNLSVKKFTDFPVWKWNDSEDGHEPVVNWQPLAKDEPTLFISSRFITADGTELNGYLVGLESFYAFGIFIGDDEYVFNLNLPDMMDLGIRAICSHFELDGLKMFPLEYVTTVSHDGIHTIQGVLNCDI